MALYDTLPVFGDTYSLTKLVFTVTQDFPREYKFTLGQDMKRDCLNLLRSIYRVNRSQDKAGLLDSFLDDFELPKLEIRLCHDMKLISIMRQDRNLDQAVEFTRIRLCLPKSRDSKVRDFLELNPPSDARELATIWWDL